MNKGSTKQIPVANQQSLDCWQGHLVKTPVGKVELHMTDYSLDPKLAATGGDLQVKADAIKPRVEDDILMSQVNDLKWDVLVVYFNPWSVFHFSFRDDSKDLTESKEGVQS